MSTTDDKFDVNYIQFPLLYLNFNTANWTCSVILWQQDKRQDYESSKTIVLFPDPLENDTRWVTLCLPFIREKWFIDCDTYVYAQRDTRGF